MLYSIVRAAEHRGRSVHRPAGRQSSLPSAPVAWHTASRSIPATSMPQSARWQTLNRATRHVTRSLESLFALAPPPPKGRVMASVTQLRPSKKGGVGYGRPASRISVRKGQSGNRWAPEGLAQPRHGARPHVEEPVTVTENGRRHTILNWRQPSSRSSICSSRRHPGDPSIDVDGRDGGGGRVRKEQTKVTLLEVASMCLS